MNRTAAPRGPYTIIIGALMALAAFAVCFKMCAPDASAAPVLHEQAKPAASASASELRTEHYDLYVEGMDAREVGSMLEQLHAQLSKYFGAAPKGRLPLAIYATQERWVAALQADRQYVPQGAGGYYAPQTQKAYLWVQPTPYFSRHLVLHEATHQFHWLTVTGNSAPKADWYVEGLAEYFGMHNWDGKRLQTGVVPAVTLEDYPSAALKGFERAGSEIQTMLAGAGRPECWALVHFLIGKHPLLFSKLSEKLDAKTESVDAWTQVFGSDTSALSKEFHQWMQKHPQEWQVVWVSWQQRGDAIESESKTTAITVLKKTPKALTVEVETLTAGGAAGLVFAFQSTMDFHLLQLLPGAKVRVTRYLNGTWMPVSVKDMQSPRQRNTLSVAQDGKSTALYVNDKKVATVDASGQVGLNVESCRSRFRVKESSAAAM